MRINETLKKPMLEAKYLNVDNTDRYRPIIRLFYLNYEKLKYWIYQEEVYEELKEDPYFQEYTPEQCQQDLTALTAWGNLITTQDTRRVTTIEEFKNKKFRYQLSKATVEIERMVIRVENLFIESSSLEPTLLERIRMNLEKIPQMQNEEPEKIYSWWNDLGSDFIRLPDPCQIITQKICYFLHTEKIGTFLINQDITGNRTVYAQIQDGSKIISV